VVLSLTELSRRLKRDVSQYEWGAESVLRAIKKDRDLEKKETTAERALFYIP